MRPANNPEGIVVEDLVRNMSNEEVKTRALAPSLEGNASWIASNFFDPLYEEERLRTHDYRAEDTNKENAKNERCNAN